MPGRRARNPRPLEIVEAEASRGKRVAGYSLDQLAEMLGPHVPAAMATLGQKAADGDGQAARTILDFLATVARDGGTDRGNEVLEQIAKIRGNSGAAS